MTVELRNIIMQWVKTQKDVAAYTDSPLGINSRECTIHCTKCNCRIAYVYGASVLAMHMNANDMKARYGSTAVDAHMPFCLLASHPQFFDNLADVISHHPCAYPVVKSCPHPKIEATPVFDSLDDRDDS